MPNICFYWLGCLTIATLFFFQERQTRKNKRDLLNLLKLKMYMNKFWFYNFWVTFYDDKKCVWWSHKSGLRIVCFNSPFLHPSPFPPPLFIFRCERSLDLPNPGQHNHFSTWKARESNLTVQLQSDFRRRDLVLL